MQDELEILRDVSMRLESAGIAFMLTGSVAMNYLQKRAAVLGVGELLDEVLKRNE